jgi:hypothetical protein
MDLEEKRASLHKEALEMLASVSEMEEQGASESEIAAKIQEANKIIEYSGSLSPLIDEIHRKRTLKARALIAVVVFVVIGVIALQVY